MQGTVETLREFFEALLYEQDAHWIQPKRGSEPSKSAQDAFVRAQSSGWYAVREMDLTAWITPSDSTVYSTSRPRHVMYLPPLKRDAAFVPVLRIAYKNGEWANLCLEVVLMRIVEDGEKATLCGFGFRLECGEGMHAFYHAQLIQGFKYGLSVESPSWLPETQPSFPLTAKCPVTLLLCLLLTLYGKCYCRDFYSRHSIFRLSQYMKELDPWIKWGAHA